MNKLFETWKRQWFKYIPKCADFVCCHELSSCGVDKFCGDSTIYPTWNDAVERHLTKPTCTNVGCADCLRNHDCEKRNK